MSLIFISQYSRKPNPNPYSEAKRWPNSPLRSQPPRLLVLHADLTVIPSNLLNLRRFPTRFPSLFVLGAKHP